MRKVREKLRKVQEHPQKVERKRQAEQTAPAWQHRWRLAGTSRRRAGRALEGALVCQLRDAEVRKDRSRR